jgi:hypothetical protein
MDGITPHAGGEVKSREDEVATRSSCRLQPVG